MDLVIGQMPNYLFRLKQEFSKRQARSPSYSLRAYARDLGMHPSTLSHVLGKTRPLPLKNVPVIVDRLRLTPAQEKEFIDSLKFTNGILDQVKLDPMKNKLELSECHYNLIAEWEHYAVLTLLDVGEVQQLGGEALVDHLATRFELGRLRVEVVLENLRAANLIQADEYGRYKVLQPGVSTTADVPSRAIREGHRGALKIAEQKLDQVDVALRDFSSLMVALDPNDLPEFKQMLREFRRKVDQFCDQRKADKDSGLEVYEIAMQLYPLTKQQVFS